MNIARCNTGAKGIFLVRKFNVLCYFKGVPFEKNAAKSYQSRFRIQGSLFFEGCLFLKGLPFCRVLVCRVLSCRVPKCRVPNCQGAFL